MIYSGDSLQTPRATNQWKEMKHIQIIVTDSTSLNAKYLCILFHIVRGAHLQDYMVKSVKHSTIKDYINTCPFIFKTGEN